MAELRGRRVLVTGAAGFVGANLVRGLLTEGADVVALVRPGSPPARLEGVLGDVELHEVDLRERAALAAAVARAGPELAVGCAVAGGHPTTTDGRLTQLEVSVLGTAALVEALAAAGCERLVQLGSSLEYGPRPAPMHEDDRLAPSVPRGAVKAAETLVALAWAGSLGLPAVVLRPFAVYGPWELESRIVPKAIRAALDGTELPLAGPHTARDFVYVGDVVDAVLRALAAPAGVAGAVVNLGTGVQTTLEELVAAIERVVGRELRTAPGAYPTQPHDARTWVADVGRAQALLGWSPSTTLDEGLRLTADWLSSRTVPR